MSIHEILCRLRELARAIPRNGCDWEDRPTFTSPASPEDISTLESLVGFALPADVRSFFSEADSVIGMSIHNGYYIGGTLQISASLQRNDFPQHVDAEAVMPIATDGGGNSFLLGRSGKIWKWDCETKNAAYVIDTFGGFLNLVADDWNAYVFGTEGWHFLV